MRSKPAREHYESMIALQMQGAPIREIAEIASEVRYGEKNNARISGAIGHYKYFNCLYTN